MEPGKSEPNNEQLILEAAEQEFLEKGFGSAKTTSIAKRAGVTHAMLHYYFRTKENLFQVVFQKKVQIAADSFEPIFSEGGSLDETVRNFVESHFDFISKNPRLISFIYNEVISNEKNREFVLNCLYPKLSAVFGSVESFIDKEVAKGTMRPIKPLEFIMNIVSLNISIFMFLPVIEAYMSEEDPGYVKNMLARRKESNVQFILNAIKL